MHLLAIPYTTGPLFTLVVGQVSIVCVSDLTDFELAPGTKIQCESSPGYVVTQVCDVAMSATFF